MRETLPTRRQNLGGSFRYPPEALHRTHVMLGFSKDGRPLECFIRGGGKSRSDRDYLLDDIGVLVSRLLQFGDTLDAIRSSLGRNPSGDPMSIAGAALDGLTNLAKVTDK